MSGMGSEYDKRRSSYAVPSNENPCSSDPANAWSRLEYERRLHGTKNTWPYSGSLPPPPLDSEVQQQLQEQPPMHMSAAAAPMSQQWYGYYPPQQSQQGGQVNQQGVSAPPLPSVPPPQAPLPPNPGITPTWASVVEGGPNGATDSTYTNYYSHPHQQQGQELSGYGVEEVQPVSNSTSSIVPAPSNTASANGSQSYGQAYAGYTGTGEQYVYGSTNFQGYNNYGYTQQGGDSYSQNTSAYPNSSTQYAPPNAFQNTSSLTDTSSYPSTTTYFDAGAYQTAGYQTSVYSGHTNTWSDNSYGNYGYTGYAAPNLSTAANSDSAMQYQQDNYHQQWVDYYASYQTASQAGSESCTIPGTDPAMPCTTVPPPTYASVVAATPPHQPPPPGTVQPSWQHTAPSYATISSQGSSTTASSTGAGHWDAASKQSSQSEQYAQTYFPPLPQQTHPIAQPQQQSVSSQKTQMSLHLQQQQFKTGKLQIPTNPRIAPNVGGHGSGKEVQKPAYISIPAKTVGLKLSTDAVADATLQPGMFPPSLRAYVERALSRCKDEAQKASCQDIMKEMITAASLDGSLFTKDWDTEPLFPLPSMPSTSGGKEVKQQGNVATFQSKVERSPNKRSKTRWEPVASDDIEEKQGRPLSLRGVSKENFQDRAKDRDGSASPMKWDKREVAWSKNNTSQHQQPQLQAKRLKRGPKKFHQGNMQSMNGGLNTSSESEEEEDQTGSMYLGSLSAAETPEEKKRRQNRTKRFDRGKDPGRGLKGFGRGRVGAGGSASARRATALQLALSSGDGQNGRAVEDIDWDSLTVRGTCQEIEKRYLRLTSAPDPHTVRPEEVLRKALSMVQTTLKNYLFRCEQLKSIRQDLTVQRIRNELTVQVYETHARMALEAGDLPEYNQCQTQLKGLYAEGIKGCCNEFAAYSLLYIVFQHGNSRDLLSAMARLTREGKKDQAVKHALAVRTAVAVGNYTTFFRLYRTAPNLSPCLMDLYVERMRFEAVRCMARSYRPTVPVSFVARTLGFTSIPGSEGETEGLEECEEWLKAHGSHLQFESSSAELVLDAKMSATSLFMPEPEDVVPHGDANLALNDFFARS